MQLEPSTTARRGALRSARPAAVAVATLTLLAGATAAQAAILYTGGSGVTVYGVAAYGGGGEAAPVFIGNNVTHFNDVMASPGHGFLLADPSIPNNIREFGPAPLGLATFQIGGGNANGAFGAGQTLITGPQIGFRLADTVPGGGSASYMISSWDANFTVDAGGFLGNFGNYLSIGGRLADVNSAAAVSLVSNYYLNGAYVGQAAPLILAAAGNGNFQALGGSGAAVLIGPGGAYRGLAINNIAANLAAGTNLTVRSTLTAFADPASIEMIAPDLDLLGPGFSLPDFAFSSSRDSVPEPSIWAMLVLGFASAGAALRRRMRLSPG